MKDRRVNLAACIGATALLLTGCRGGGDLAYSLDRKCQTNPNGVVTEVVALAEGQKITLGGNKLVARKPGTIEYERIEVSSGTIIIAGNALEDISKRFGARVSLTDAQLTRFEVVFNCASPLTPF